MKKSAWFWTILILIVVFGAIFGTRAWLNHRAAFAAAHAQFPPTTVTTAVAALQNWAPNVTAVGSLEAVSGTEITAQIAGNVTEIAFHSGTPVQKGALLVGLDDSTQLAQLHADQAKLQLASATLTRDRKLYATHAVSQLDLQTAEADAGTARAAVEGDRAILAKLRISAPFSGVVGIREVSLGQYVSPGTNVVNLQRYDPLYLDFTLPQRTLAELAVGQAVKFTADAFPGHTFTGRITALGSEVDPTTRNVSAQATLPNPDGHLRPGLYGNVELTLGEARRGIVIPATALTFSTFGDSVYVVQQGAKGALTAHAQVVQVSDQRGGKALIASGLKAGDTVVTGGQNKLQDGAPVVVNNSVQP